MGNLENDNFFWGGKLTLRITRHSDSSSALGSVASTSIAPSEPSSKAATLSCSSSCARIWLVTVSAHG